MILLLLGLVVFVGLHSIKIYANDWRAAFIEKRGDNAFKGLYSVLSLIGLVLIVVGFGQTRQSPVYIWNPPVAMNHVAALLVLIAFVLLAAAYVPGNRIKATVGHPMLLSVKVWAFAHLLANGRLGDIILFASFLAWAVVMYIRSRKKDRHDEVIRVAAPGIAKDAMAVVVGTGVWFAFAFWGHLALIGVSPFGV